MLTLILEAAFRSALMAVLVWASIRVLRVHHVFAQKVAWVLVLLAAVFMPMVMHTPWLALNRAFQIPLRRLTDIYPGTTSVVARTLDPHSARLYLASTYPDLNPVLGSDAITTHSDAVANARSATAVASTNSSQPTLSSAIDTIQSRRQTLVASHLNHRFTSQDAVSGLPSSGTGSRNEISIETRPDHGRLQSSVAKLLRASSWPSARQFLWSVYLVVGSFFLLRLATASAIALRVWHRSKPVRNFAASFSHVQSADAVSHRSLSVRASPDLATPVTIGKTILLPASYVHWNSTKLRIVLAHESSHVRQGDFYLQLAAQIHSAVFWFSPLGWWLQRKLSDLGEALSDRAGLAEAPNRAAYAQILLDFASIRQTNPFRQPIAGVAMARTNNISSRIDRILSDRRFNLAFLGGRRHAILTALIVPAALVAVVACIRVVPAVEAARSQAVSATSPKSLGQIKEDASQASNSRSQSETSDTTNSQTVDRTLQLSTDDSRSSSDQVVSTEIITAQANEPVAPADSKVAPVAPAPPPPPPTTEAKVPVAPEPPEDSDIQEPAAPAAPGHKHGFAATYSMDDDDSFAILSGKDSDVTINGHHNKDFEEARRKYHNNFIWFERDGKSYVITDPAILAKSEAMFKQDPALKLKQEELERIQSKLDAEMKNLQPEIDKASLPGPEFQQQMAKLNAELATLQSEKFKHLTEDIAKQVNESTKVTSEMAQKITQENMEKLGELQEQIGNIQGRLGEIQGEIGEREGRMGEKQGEIGERMGKIGEQMGRIGEEQGRKAEEASRRMKSILDQAVKDGKAKPVD